MNPINLNLVFLVRNILVIDFVYFLEQTLIYLATVAM